MTINKETLDIYLCMHELLARCYTQAKMPIHDAAKYMIAAIDECGNIPPMWDVEAAR